MYSILIPIFLLNSKKEAAWVSLRPISPAPSTRSQDSWLPFRRSHLSPAVLIRPTSQLKLHRWNPPLRWTSLHPPLSNPPLEQKSNPPINLLLCPCHRPRQWHPPPPHSNLDLPNRYEDLFFFTDNWRIYVYSLSLSFLSLFQNCNFQENQISNVESKLIENQQQEIQQDNLKTQIVSAITDLEGDREFVDFGKENKTIELTSPEQKLSPPPVTSFTPTKQVKRSVSQALYQVSTYCLITAGPETTGDHCQHWSGNLALLTLSCWYWFCWII